MLFNSYYFIFAFLPTTLFGFYILGKAGYPNIAISWLVGTSLFFYGWWNPAYLCLIFISIMFNYGIGIALSARDSSNNKYLLLICGVSANLGLLGYYKYAGFFITEVNTMFGASIHLEAIVLPLAISFFTFQQIAYLVDTYRGETQEHNFLHYCLFVTFFPQLIAGPIVHHKEILPQFARGTIHRLNHQNLAVGIAVFTIGLFKKIVIADGIAIYANPVFSAAEAGTALSFFEAWGGALAYTFQLYFDFSGYSDMAIGLARMFGIHLPNNFLSPYKATSIIEFWRYWHMTLSRFLRDYIYIPLGGSRRGNIRRHINILTTMLLGGLWHGAGWTFIYWGALHGVYLIINHSWRGLLRALGYNPGHKTWLGLSMSRLLTFTAIVISWVFFRAESMDGAFAMLYPMFGVNGVSLPASMADNLGALAPWLSKYKISFDGTGPNNLANWSRGMPLVAGLLLVVWYAPNTQQIMYRYRSEIATYRAQIKPPRFNWLQWDIHPGFSLINILLLVYTFWAMTSTEVSEFLYFQF